MSFCSYEKIPDNLDDKNCQINQNNEWREQVFTKDMCQGVIINEGSGEILVSGRVQSQSNSPMITYWAASPADRLQSFSGSGLPFPNPEMAFQNTPNKGAVRAENGEFKFRIRYPNAYYVGLGTLYVPPFVYLKVCDSEQEDTYQSIQIDGGIPYRMLTYPAPPSKKPRTSPLFYHEPEQKTLVRSQEQILRESAYPATNAMPDNFWGRKPPC